MSLDDWFRIPVTQVPISELLPRQGCLLIDRLADLIAGGPRTGGDQVGHVVLFRDQLFIHDGHHDWALRWFRGEKYMPVRVKQVNTPCDGSCGC